MGKTSSPVKRTSNGGTGGATASSTSSSSPATVASDDLLLTDRTERVESTIVSRENATHAAFAASRTVDFMYAPSPQYIRLLNDYCTGADPSSVLVVVGPSGSGKSALLAHWAAQQRTAEESGGHEFVYEHYCGCSFDSVKLSLFLFRLMNQLKITYALRDFELPREHEEEKLKFSFARCLEAAVGRGNQRNAVATSSKERRIVLILDGIDCIRTEDGGDSLSWLPNTFLPGVRIIVSATHTPHPSQYGLQCAQLVTRKPVAYDADGDLIYDTKLPSSTSDSHAIRELRRRRTTFILIEPLNESACRGLLHQCGVGDQELEAMVALPGSASPLYLRLLLQVRGLFTSDSVWLDRAAQCYELHQVYELILRRWNELLLRDLGEKLDRLRAEAELEQAYGGHHHHKLQRRSTKRDVTADHSSPHTLQRTPSLQSSGASPSPSSSSQQLLVNVHASEVTSAEIEALQTTMEQRVLLVRHTVSLLAVARYGLSATDLIRLLSDDVPRDVVEQLLTLLAPHLMRIHRSDCDAGPVELLDLSHNQLRLLVRYGFLRDDALRTCYYRELASYFGGLEASQRRVDELPVQLERCGQWAALQSALVDIKMFQLWWSERNRQEFFSYWMVLRSNCSVHDPVDDFVRSLDDFIVHETPSAKQLLALCLTITDFLRTWQRIDESRGAVLALARPPPPQLHEFLASVGGFNTAHWSEHEAKRVQSEVNALVIHKDDAYFVRRWLWTQFPLVAVAFESRFLSSVACGTASQVKTLHTSAAATLKDRESDDSNLVSSSQTAGSGSGSASRKEKPAAGRLPKTITTSATTTKASSNPTTKPRKPSLLVAPSPSVKEFDAIPEDQGAFEFLSQEHTELSVGSVAKCESQLMALRARCDKFQFALRERQTAAAVLDSRLLDARAQARAAGQSAGQLDELLEQIRVVNGETLAGRQRGEYYRAILRHCEIHPARDANAIETAETAVNKLRHEVVELQQKAQVVTYETRLAAAESKRLQQVIADQAQIHATALARLRWRHELMQRMAATGTASAAGDRHTEDEEDGDVEDEVNDDDEEEDDEDDDDDLDDGGDPASETKPVHQKSRRGRPRRQSTLLDSQLSRAKDKLLHKKETTLERLRKSESLKVYVGSPYKDDGVLGTLRQVGINKPEEAHLYWQDQQQHAAQLESEERALDRRVSELRDKLESLQATYLALKLGGSGNDDAHATTHDQSGSASNTGSSSANGSATPVSSASSVAPSSSEASAGAAAATHNLKFLEQQLTEAALITQQKKERAARLKSLSERLHLGLHHVSQVLGVTSTQHMESIELADAVEQVVRLYLGDEGHLQASTSTGLRRKNSVRAMGLANQSGLHAFVPPDLRSDDEKVKYNVRVSRSPQRQMNPYVDGDAVLENGHGDDHDNDSVDAGDGHGEIDVETSNQQDDGQAVTRRADIKNRSRLELDRKLRTPVAKPPREKGAKTSKMAKKPLVQS